MGRAGQSSCDLLRHRLRLFAAGARVLLLEPVDAASRIYQLLPAREEGVAGGADFHADVALVRGARLKHVATRADHVDFVISGVNTSLHFVAGDPFEPS